MSLRRGVDFGETIGEGRRLRQRMGQKRKKRGEKMEEGERLAIYGVV